MNLDEALAEVRRLQAEIAGLNAALKDYRDERVRLMERLLTAQNDVVRLKATIASLTSRPAGGEGRG
jgi:chromosome segregation ATPase